MIKVMEYAYIHIYPLAKSKQSIKNKVQQTDLVKKGNHVEMKGKKEQICKVK